jgi:hypothetical protein
MSLDQLNSQARLSDTTTADDDELVLSQELDDQRVLANGRCPVGIRYS